MPDPEKLIDFCFNPSFVATANELRQNDPHLRVSKNREPLFNKDWCKPRIPSGPLYKVPTKNGHFSAPSFVTHFLDTSIYSVRITIRDKYIEYEN